MNIEMLASRCWNLAKEFWQWSAETISSEWIAAIPFFLSMYAPDMYVYFRDESAEQEASVEHAPESDRDQHEKDAASTPCDQSQARRTLRIVHSQPESGGAADHI
jgi:hypothetical protein